MSDASITFAITTIEVVIIAIGLLGNLLSIIVFSRKTFRNNSISTYCIALSIVECITITIFISDIYNLVYNINLPDQSDALCKFVYSLGLYLNSFQAWLMVAFSVNKLLEMRVNSIALVKKKWFQWSIVAGIVLFDIVFYIYYPILLRLREIFPGYTICDVTTLGFFNTYMFLNIFEGSLIPFITMIITSILTIRALIKSRKSIERNGKLNKERKTRDRKYAISSLTLNSMFIVLKLPLLVFYILFAYYSYYNLYFYKIAFLLYMLNMSLSFFVHFITNSVFRREFLILFKVGMINGESTLSNTNKNSSTKRQISSRNQISPVAELY